MTTQPTIATELRRLIEFQRKWRRITSLSYFAGASLSIIAAAAASVVAGFGEAGAAAIIAAVAAIVASLEKVLLFRDKWTHHRAVETELELVRLKYDEGELGKEKTVAEIERIIREYSQKLPMAGGATTT
jgi:Protein of unknown function (DUF4231)